MKRENISYEEAKKNFDKFMTPQETIFERIKSFLFVPILFILVVIYCMLIFLISDYLFELIFHYNIEDLPRIGITFFAIIFWLSIYIIYKLSKLKK